MIYNSSFCGAYHTSPAIWADLAYRVKSRSSPATNPISTIPANGWCPLRCQRNSCRNTMRPGMVSLHVLVLFWMLMWIMWMELVLVLEEHMNVIRMQWYRTAWVFCRIIIIISWPPWIWTWTASNNNNNRIIWIERSWCTLLRQLVLVLHAFLGNINSCPPSRLQLRVIITIHKQQQWYRFIISKLPK